MAVTRSRICPVWAVLLLLAVAGTAGACRDVGSTEAGGGSEMSLLIEEPEDGASVEGMVDLVVSVEGAEIGPPDSGAMHVHVYVDDSSQYEVITTTESSVSVPNGEHTLRVVLAQPNHEETEIADDVTFSVSAATGDTGDTGGGYGGGYG